MKWKNESADLTAIRSTLMSKLHGGRVPPPVSERFRCLVESLERQRSVNAIGYAATLVELQRAGSYWSDCADLIAAPGSLPRLAVIGGVPRSGTSFLQATLAAAEGLRCVRAWEQEPAWLAKADRWSATAACADRYGLVSEFTPEVHAMHPLRAGGFDECTPLLAASGLSPQFVMMLGVPTFGRILSASREGSHSVWAGAIARLASLEQASGAVFVVKSPFHFLAYSSLSPLLRDDDLVVHVLRDPVDVFTSLLNMTFHLRRRFCADAEPQAMGGELLSMLDLWLSTSTDDLNEIGDRLVLIRIRDLKVDPIRSIRQAVLEPLEISVDEERLYLATRKLQKQNDEARARYRLMNAAEFGVERSEIRKVLAKHEEFFDPS